MTAKIAITDLQKVYRTKSQPNGLLALDGVSLQIQSQEFVAILGPSGCGKSTILNILSGLDESFQGEIRIDGRPLRDHSGARPRIGYVFQEPRLLPWLTVKDNIRFALDCEGIPRDTWNGTIQRVLDIVGLSGFEKLYPHQLSGGMQQRASIARAFAVDPDILLMDEPFSALDEITARGLRKKLLEIWSQFRKTVIFVTHNCFEATYLADRIFVMSRRPGRIYREIEVAVPRPRDYDDPVLFEYSASIVKTFLHEIGEES